MGIGEERYEILKEEIRLLIDELHNDEEYLERLKKQIQFKIIDYKHNKNNTEL